MLCSDPLNFTSVQFISLNNIFLYTHETLMNRLFFLLQVFTYKQSTITHQKVTAMHQTSVESVEDMAALVDLHEGSIMHNLFQRYQQNKIYVSVF